jgi:hypothetical protein
MRSSRFVGYLAALIQPDALHIKWTLISLETYNSSDLIWIEAYRVWRQYRNDQPERLCVTLGVRHPFANSAGYQRLARFVIADAIGYLPDAMTHTHHVDRNAMNDAIDNLELISAQYHGRIHASGVCVGRGRDGRFVSLEEMGEAEQQDVARETWWPRHGAIVGNQARDTQRA